MRRISLIIQILCAVLCLAGGAYSYWFGTQISAFVAGVTGDTVEGNPMLASAAFGFVAAVGLVLLVKHTSKSEGVAWAAPFFAAAAVIVWAMLFFVTAEALIFLF